MGRGREAGHVHADLGDDPFGCGDADSRDFIQVGHRWGERRDLGVLGQLLEQVLLPALVGHQRDPGNGDSCQGVGVREAVDCTRRRSMPPEFFQCSSDSAQT